MCVVSLFFFFQAKDGIRFSPLSGGLGVFYKRHPPRPTLQPPLGRSGVRAGSVARASADDRIPATGRYLCRAGVCVVGVSRKRRIRYTLVSGQTKRGIGAAIHLHSGRGSAVGPVGARSALARRHSRRVVQVRARW